MKLSHRHAAEAESDNYTLTSNKPPPEKAVNVTKLHSSHSMNHKSNTKRGLPLNHVRNFTAYHELLKDIVDVIYVE